MTHEVFETRRKDYHRALQASYFAAHRIVGTQVYIARSGDSLWTLTQRGGQLPQWLLQQYNPSLDFADLRAGTQIVMPRVEEVGTAAADMRRPLACACVTCIPAAACRPCL